MTYGKNKITVQVKYRDIEKTFSGPINDVWRSINKFFADFIPAFEIAKKVILTVDLQNLTEDCEKTVVFTDDGPHLLVSKDKLTDNETLALQLLACYIGFRLGMAENDAVSRDELKAKLGKSSKITSTRLSELVKSEIVKKTADGRYKITTFGIAQVQRDLLPKIRARTAA